MSEKKRNFNKQNLGFQILWIFSLIVMILLYFFFFQLKKNDQTLQTNLAQKNISQNPEQISKFCFQEYCFDLEIADTLEKRMQGLMYRESLDKDKGMLFDSKEENMHYFWMKNTLIPLDIIRIDKNLEVLEIISAPSCIQDPCPSYGPDKPSRWVIELNSWSAKSIWLEAWNPITLELSWERNWE